MIQLSSPEEIAARKKRVAELYASDSLTDNITGILMDLRWGGFGMWEETARAKAAAIVERTEEESTHAQR